MFTVVPKNAKKRTAPKGGTYWEIYPSFGSQVSQVTWVPSVSV